MNGQFIDPKSNILDLLEASVTDRLSDRPVSYRAFLQALNEIMGWSGGAMVLGKLPVPGRPTILITVGQGPIALAVGAGGGGLDIFTFIYPFPSLSLFLGDGPIYFLLLHCCFTSTVNI